MYQAFYRKYRPLVFSDVCGQDNITRVLKHEVSTGNISHAYLFHGSRGTGKTTCAKILARAVNCESPVNGDPCGKCDACLASASSECPDIIEMDAASNNGVDYIRDLREMVNFSASVLSRRVYIIDEVHMLSGAAFNALLKTLEEPPEGVVFILATTELQKIPSTILSRCQRFDFHRIETGIIVDRLKYIAAKESISIDDDAALTIARLSFGGMRDAISLLELAAGNNQTVTESLVNEISGVFGRDKCIRIVEALIDKDYGCIFEITSDLYNKSFDPGTFCKDIISFIRDIIVYRTVKNPEKFLDYTSSEREVLSGFKAVDINILIYMIKVLQSAYNEISHTDSSTRVILETALINASSPEEEGSFTALSARVSSLEQKLSARSFTSPRTTDNKTVNSSDAEKEAQPKAVKPEINQSKPAESYTDFIEWIDIANSITDPAISAFAASAECFIDRGNRVLLLRTTNSPAFMLLDSDSSKESIKKALIYYNNSFSDYSIVVKKKNQTSNDPFQDLN